MTGSDMQTAAASSPTTRMQLIASIHLQDEPDGGAIVIDDRTLTASRLNKAASIILHALQRPCTQEDLVTLLADAAECGTDDAAAPVAKLVTELLSFGWIEFRNDAAGTGAPDGPAAR